MLEAVFRKNLLRPSDEPFGWLTLSPFVFDIGVSANADSKGKGELGHLEGLAYFKKGHLSLSVVVAAIWV